MTAKSLLLFLLIACSGCSSQVDVLGRVVSPDGTMEAIHAQPKTGATVGFVDWVYVVPAGSNPRGEPVFIADKVVEPLRLSWADNVLTITAARARVFRSASTTMVHAPQGNITATLKVVVAEPLS